MSSLPADRRLAVPVTFEQTLPIFHAKMKRILVCFDLVQRPQQPLQIGLAPGTVVPDSPAIKIKQEDGTFVIDQNIMRIQVGMANTSPMKTGNAPADILPGCMVEIGFR